MQYLEFIFTTDPRTDVATDLLSAVLADTGFESFVTQDDGALAAYIPAKDYDPARLESALADFPLADTHIDYTWSDVPRADYDIVINPQMAFGTGHHQTTGLMMRELLDTDLTGLSVLDMGCGTSILAILARMRGAARCTAVDIDEWCVRNSLENIALNGVDGIDVRLGDASCLAEEGPFDVVIANINRNILLADMHAYVARMNTGATLLMSGFYTDDIPLLRAEGERLGLVFVHQREDNHWAAVRMTRP